MHWQKDRRWRVKVTKGIPNTPGIYAIKCTSTNKIYIGATKKLRKRIFNHLYGMSISPKHSAMGQDYRDYGKETFEIFILEHITDISLLTEREKYWYEQTHLDTYNKDYPKKNRYWGKVNGR